MSVVYTWYWAIYITEGVKDFLSLLVLARDEDNQPLPDDLVFENVCGIMFAGFDVSIFCFYSISKLTQKYYKYKLFNYIM